MTFVDFICNLFGIAQIYYPNRGRTLRVQSENYTKNNIKLKFNGKTCSKFGSSN